MNQLEMWKKSTISAEMKKKNYIQNLYIPGWIVIITRMKLLTFLIIYEGLI